MGDAKIPIALVFAMAVQLVALVWYISGMVHKIEHLETTLVSQQKLVENLSYDVGDLWQFCTFTENKWAKDYTNDMVYQRLCGNKEPVEE
jgi:hypothetical protein